MFDAQAPLDQLHLLCVFLFFPCPKHGWRVLLACTTGGVERADKFVVVGGSIRAEMDEYIEFASDDFDVKGWINATAASHLQQQQQHLAAGAEANGSASSETTALSSLNAHR